MSNIIRFSGFIRLESPVSIVIHSTPTKKDDPSPVPTTAVWDAETNALVSTVCIPSSSFRGGLRRAALNDLMARRKEANLDGFNLRSYYMLAIGGTRSKGSAPQVFNASAEKGIRHRNPFMSLFGGADLGDTYFLHSKLAIGHLLPATPLSLEACPHFATVRIDDMLRTPDRVLPKLDESAGQAWSDLHVKTTATSALKKEKIALKKQAKNLRTAGDQVGLRAVNESLRNIEDQLDVGTTSTQMPAPGYRVLPAGLILNSTITLRDVNDIELGLWLGALREFSFDPFLGGHRAQGCGQISAEWAVSMSRRQQPTEKLGSILINDQVGIEIPDHPILVAAESAWQAASIANDFSYQITDREDEGDDEASAA